MLHFSSIVLSKSCVLSRCPVKGCHDCSMVLSLSSHWYISSALLCHDEFRTQLAESAGSILAGLPLLSSSCVGRCFFVPGLCCGLDLLSCGELKLACMPPLNAPTPHLAAQGSPALDSGRHPPQGLGSEAAGSCYLFHAVCLPLSAHSSRLLICLMSCFTSSVPPLHLVCSHCSGFYCSYLWAEAEASEDTGFTQIKARPLPLWGLPSNEKDGDSFDNYSDQCKVTTEGGLCSDGL